MIGHLEWLQLSHGPVPSTSPFIRFYPFAEGGVLYLPGCRRIWILNTSSAFIWCLLNEVATVDQLALNLSATFAIDHTTALQDVRETIAGFFAEGLLEGGSPLLSEDQVSSGRGIEQPQAIVPEAVQWTVREEFQTPGRRFRFVCQDASLGEEFTGLLTHLNAPASQTVTNLAVLADGASDTWAVYLDDCLFAAGLARNEVVPYLFTILFVRSSEAFSDKLLFHAAVLGRTGQVVLFPAEAGCGKTTLAAALTARGHLFYADELAVLDRGNLQVIPLPLPMSIKKGSTAVLEGYYRGLAAQGEHLRADGQWVRYLRPPPGRSAGPSSAGAEIEAVVFPRYRRGAEARMVESSKRVALQKLARTGSSDRPLEAADVEAMIALVEGRSCWELEYSDLSRAIFLLENSLAALSGESG